MTHPRDEALLFGRYLLGSTPDEPSLLLFERAMATLPMRLDAKDDNLLRFMLAHPWSIGMIDAWLALTHPYALVRGKIFVMLAIVETQPRYAHLFLPRPRGVWYLGYLGFVGCRAVCNAVLGACVVKGLRL